MLYLAWRRLTVRSDLCSYNKKPRNFQRPLSIAINTIWVCKKRILATAIRVINGENHETAGQSCNCNRVRKRIGASCSPEICPRRRLRPCGRHRRARGPGLCSVSEEGGIRSLLRCHGYIRREFRQGSDAHSRREVRPYRYPL